MPKVLTNVPGTSVTSPISITQSVSPPTIKYNSLGATA